MIYALIYLWWTLLAIGIFLYKVPSGTRKAWLAGAATNILLCILGFGLFVSILLVFIAPWPGILSSNMFFVIIALLEFSRR